MSGNVSFNLIFSRTSSFGLLHTQPSNVTDVTAKSFWQMSSRNTIITSTITVFKRTHTTLIVIFSSAIYISVTSDRQTDWTSASSPVSNIRRHFVFRVVFGMICLHLKFEMRLCTHWNAPLRNFRHFNRFIHHCCCAEITQMKLKPVQTF